LNMLSDSELVANLAYYEALYNSSSNDMRTTLLCSKASILEVCGWVEQAMDLLVSESANRCSLSTNRIKWIDEKYIQTTYGFSYKKHFEKMIVSVVGYRLLEIAEKAAGAQFLVMTGTLTSITPLRNHYAHTHFDLLNPYPKNMTSIPAPTTMKNHAQNANLGLKALEDQLISLGC
jgi:hypothetical protein